MLSYAEYYKRCQQTYVSEGNIVDSNSMSLYDLGVEILKPSEPNKLDIIFPEDYESIIDSLSKRIKYKAENSDEQFCDADGDKLATKVANIWDLEELEIISNFLIPQLEKKVFHSHILLSAIHVYRNLKTDSAPNASWLWHWDNNPKEAVKCLIYLTDVTANSGPFEFLRHKDTHKAVKMETSRTGINKWKAPMYTGSRVPSHIINNFCNNGYQRCIVTGKRGTILFFDNNIVHKANIPTESYRDVAILNIRPVHKRIVPYVDKETCGSWGYVSPVMDPEAIKAIKK